MAKVVKAKIKLQVPAGAATPAPPVGSSLGQQGANIMEFCKAFNAKTAHRKGEICPVKITVYTDKSFDFEVKTEPASIMLKKRAKITKGAAKVGAEKVGRISWNDVEEIAKAKMVDLNANDLEQAKKIIAGTAKSIGIEIV